MKNSSNNQGWTRRVAAVVSGAAPVVFLFLFGNDLLLAFCERCLPADMTFVAALIAAVAATCSGLLCGAISPRSDYLPLSVLLTGCFGLVLLDIGFAIVESPELRDVQFTAAAGAGLLIVVVLAFVGAQWFQGKLSASREVGAK